MINIADINASCISFRIRKFSFEGFHMMESKKSRPTGDDDDVNFIPL